MKTDCQALLWIHSFKNLEVDGILARWIIRLADYNYTIEYKKGKLHQNADALSRRPMIHCKRRCVLKDCQDCLQVVGSLLPSIPEVIEDDY